MDTISRKGRWLVAVLAALLSLAAGVAAAHEGREVGQYRLIVGWIEEPTYEGLANGVLLVVHKTEDAQGHHHGAGTAAHDHAEELTPVEGLESTLLVEITHLATGASKVVNLYAADGEPGRYTAVVIPTAPGVYEFRVFGTIEGMQLDETFASMGGGGDIDDVITAADLQFPETLPQARELENAVRGALQTAQRAEDAALAASEDDDEDGVDPLLAAALALGAIGACLGAAALAMALRASRRG